MSAADNLRAARALIEDPKHWTQGRYATTADGYIAFPGESDAACFCSIGAVRRITNDDWGLTGAAVGVLSKAVGEDIVQFNDADGRTHAEVLAAFDKAIEFAEAQS